MGAPKQTGKNPGPKARWNPFPTPTSHGQMMMIKYLASCGYKAVGYPTKDALGWFKFAVLDRKTGEDAGFRWVRATRDGSFSVVRRDPSPEP